MRCEMICRHSGCPSVYNFSKQSRWASEPIEVLWITTRLLWHIIAPCSRLHFWELLWSLNLELVNPLGRLDIIGVKVKAHWTNNCWLMSLHIVEILYNLLVGTWFPAGGQPDHCNATSPEERLRRFEGQELLISRADPQICISFDTAPSAHPH